MKNLSISSVLEKNKISSENALVFALDINIVDPNTNKPAEVIHLVNYSVNLRINEIEYIRFPFEMNFNDESGEVQNLNLTIQDQAGIIMPYLRKYRGGLASTVVVRLVTVMPDDSTTSIDFAEVFEVINTNVNNYTVSFELGAENPLSRICPERTQMKDRCSFRYKSKECGYKGNKPTCDLSLLGDNGCRVHNNGRRFGGFPSITVMNI